MSSALTRICLVRHGETEWNVARRIQGQIDIGLNALGLRQAEAAARWLAEEPVSALFSSDLRRARTTAEHIGRRLGLACALAPEMRERRYGILEGVTYEDARTSLPEVYAAFESRDPEFAIPGGGESLVQFHARVTTWLKATVEAHLGGTLVVVTHGGVLDIVNRFVRGNALAIPRDFAIPNAGLNWIVRAAGDWRIEAWGQTAHLETTALDEL